MFTPVLEASVPESMQMVEGLVQLETTKWLPKAIPSRASASMDGVRPYRFSMASTASARSESMEMKTTFGGREEMGLRAKIRGLARKSARPFSEEPDKPDHYGYVIERNAVQVDRKVLPAAFGDIVTPDLKSRRVFRSGASLWTARTARSSRPGPPARKPVSLRARPRPAG